VLRASRPLGVAAGLAAFAAIGVWLLFRATLDYGFHYDDYGFVRPYRSADVLAAFSGPWDPSGIQVPFYRPLTIAFYAARFELLGLNSYAHHALSLILFALAAALAGLFAWRVTRSAIAGALATAFFTIHPSMPYSIVVWGTNQMHLLSTLVVLLALLWWNEVRTRSIAWWLPLLLAGAAAFLLKEDGIVLLPVIIILHCLRVRLLEPTLPPVRRSFVSISLLCIVMLIGLRWSALEQVGGYGLPTVERAWMNFRRGLGSVFTLAPPDRQWQLIGSWFVILLPLTALAVWRRASARPVHLMLTGAVVALAFNLPFVMVTKLEQLHLVATGAVFVLAGAASALFDAARSRTAAAIVAGSLVLGMVALGAVARDISKDFAPFGPIVLATDQIVRDWWTVPRELRDYLQRKREPGAENTLSPNPAEALEVVTFGLHANESGPDNVPFRWMAGPRVRIFVRPTAREILVPLRHEIGAFGGPTEARVDVDGVTQDVLRLDNGDWRMSRLALAPRRLSTLGRMHRISIAIDRWWVPAGIIPGSTDTRVLGLQVGTLEVR
jgi:hypothetical protein